MVSTRLTSANINAYLAHIDQTAHEILIAQCVDSVLSLFPRCVLHNSDTHQQTSHRSSLNGNSPASLQNRTAKPCPSTQQSIKKPTTTKNQGREREPPLYALPTFDIPFGRSKTSAKRTSPAISETPVSHVTFPSSAQRSTTTHPVS